MMTIRDSAARHLAAGGEDLGELARLVEQDTDKPASRSVLSGYRSRFRRHGADWVDAERARRRRWRVENPEADREATRRWHVGNPARKLLGSCRSSAKARGHQCILTIEMIEEMLVPMTCSATGLPLTWEHMGSSKANPWAPSIDRLDCAKGYVPGNVRVVCWAFNQMRGDFPDEVIVALAKALAARAP